MRGRLASEEIKGLDPYALLASLGKRVIHPGGKRSTAEIFEVGAFAKGQNVLDVGCGVATTAIEIARRFGANVTAVDIAPLMLERAQVNVDVAGVGNLVQVEHGDILKLGCDDVRRPPPRGFRTCARMRTGWSRAGDRVPLAAVAARKRSSRVPRRGVSRDDIRHPR